MIELLKKDNFTFGVLLGLIAPLPVSMIFVGILTFLQQIVGILHHITISQMVLLSMAINLLLMRYYLVKLKYENTGKGLLLITIAIVIVYLIFISSVKSA